MSSNINKVIRSVFFYKISQVEKSTKRIQGTKKYQKALKSIKTTNLTFINLRFIDLRFIDLRSKIKIKNEKCT